MKRFPTHIVAVFGVVENENREVLLLKHRHHDIWMFPGGQVEVGENLVEALIREAREESGMEIEVGRMFCVTSNTCTYPGYDGYDTVPSKVIMGFACAQGPCLSARAFVTMEERKGKACRKPA